MASFRESPGDYKHLPFHNNGPEFHCAPGNIQPFPIFFFFWTFGHFPPPQLDHFPAPTHNPSLSACSFWFYSLTQVYVLTQYAYFCISISEQNNSTKLCLFLVMGNIFYMHAIMHVRVLCCYWSECFPNLLLLRKQLSNHCCLLLTICIGVLQQISAFLT